MLQSESNLVLYTGDLLNNKVVENFESEMVGKCILGKGKEKIRRGDSMNLKKTLSNEMPQKVLHNDKTYK